MENKNSSFLICKSLISIWVGISLTFFYLFVIIGIDEKTESQLIFSSLYLIIFFSIISYLIIFKYFFPQLRNLGYKDKLLPIFFIGSVLIGCYLYFAIPIIVESPNKQSLKIISKGDKNPAARGHEIRLVSIIQGTNDLIGFDKLQKKGNWEEVNGQLISAPSGKATLNWTSFSVQPITLTFIAHPWSGIVKIIWNRQIQSIDLYNSSSTTYTIQLEPQKSNNPWFVGCMVISTGVTIGLIILFLSIFFLSYSKPIKLHRKQTNLPWWVYSIPIITFWTIYLLVYWPGIMISDSFDQWNQAITWTINNNHPAFHTLFLWVVSRIWNSPAAIAVIQIIVFSLVISFGFNLLASQGTRKIWIWFASFLIAISPMNSLMVINVWKDTIFTISIFALIDLLLLIQISNGKWLHSYKNIVIVSIIGALISLFRHNGLPLAFGTFVILLVIYRKEIKYLIYSLWIFSSIYFFVQGPLYNYLKIIPAQPYLLYSLQFHHIAAHLKANTNFSSEENEFLNQIRPIEDDWDYDCYNINSTIFSSKFNASFVADKSGMLNRILLGAFLKKPLVDLRHILCSSKLIWMVKIPSNGFMHAVGITYEGNKVSTLHPASEEHRNGFYEDSKLSGLEIPLTKIIFASLSSNNWVVIWRPAFYIYLSLWGYFLVFLRDKKPDIFIPLIPIILHFGLLFFITVHQSLRYAYPIIPYFMMFWPYLFTIRWEYEQ